MAYRSSFLEKLLVFIQSVPRQKIWTSDLAIQNIEFLGVHVVRSVHLLEKIGRF